MDSTKLITHSLKGKSWESKTTRIMTAALEAVNPRNAVLSHLKREGDHLIIDDDRIDLKNIDRIYLIGAGKAGEPMVEAASEILGDLIYEGLVIVKQGYADKDNINDHIKICEAGHPYPDERGVSATSQITELLKTTKQADVVICLISGGGSALMVSPVDGVSLEDIQILTGALLASGATINEINTLRKHLDQVKGGNLARIASPAKMISLILSDVVGDYLDVIASGPTVPDPSTYEDALNIIDRYNLRDQVPASMLEHLKSGNLGKFDETPKPGDKIFLNVSNFIIGSNRSASQAALNQAMNEGFNSIVLSNSMQGEASQVGIALSAILRQAAINDQPIPRPACIIVGGETTVTLRGKGEGGRNQELALGAVRELSGLESIAFITLATDGGDGPTNAAGAVVTGETYQRGKILNLELQNFLDDNNAYNYFKPLDDLIITGPTKTNVNDLTFLFAY
jgi:hydroxypyruvate reductase